MSSTFNLALSFLSCAKCRKKREKRPESRNSGHNSERAITRTSLTQNDNTSTSALTHTSSHNHQFRPLGENPPTPPAVPAILTRPSTDAIPSDVLTQLRNGNHSVTELAVLEPTHTHETRKGDNRPLSTLSAGTIDDNFADQHALSSSNRLSDTIINTPLSLPSSSRVTHPQNSEDNNTTLLSAPLSVVTRQTHHRQISAISIPRTIASVLSAEESQNDNNEPVEILSHRISNTTQITNSDENLRPTSLEVQRTIQETGFSYTIIPPQHGQEFSRDQINSQSNSVNITGNTISLLGRALSESRHAWISEYFNNILSEDIPHHTTTSGSSNQTNQNLPIISTNNISSFSDWGTEETPSIAAPPSVVPSSITTEGTRWRASGTIPELRSPRSWDGLFSQQRSSTTSKSTEERPNAPVQNRQVPAFRQGHNRIMSTTNAISEEEALTSYHNSDISRPRSHSFS